MLNDHVGVPSSAINALTESRSNLYARVSTTVCPTPEMQV